VLAKEKKREAEEQNPLLLDGPNLFVRRATRWCGILEQGLPVR